MSKTTMQFTFDDTFNGGTPLIIEIPYRRVLSLNAYYSSLWKRMKSACVNTGLVKAEHIRCSKQVIDKASERTVFTFGNGVILNMPNEASRRDYEIVIAQLNVLQMRFD